jgi:hypothetical protein
MRPLVLGIDPGATTAIALLDPEGERPRLLGLRVVAADEDPDRWAERAYLAFATLHQIAAGRPVVGWYELTVGQTAGKLGAANLMMRRGQLLGHASDAGFRLAGFDYVMVQTWTSRLGVARKKLGDGTHRIAEAERFVEMDPATFRGLGKGAVDAAEAVLIGCARVWKEQGRKAEKPKPARKARARKVA